ncbi:peroxiredoxin-like family protein [Polaribacter sargassicola]|uniref:peroxiredoxin-like family protein n=1 Tax=Polaribacter sargassicola TaxID=2836891 RepID=UPI001F31A583|nr:peroxiredoxin-like family protein [Polaribacter sp. DS7-9]MCG1037194.1 AhpC/TSA family protein [Polaribacter sp. DS7-9]
MIKPTQKAPNLKINLVNGKVWNLEDQNPENFTLVLFYRGKHCPVCKMQLEDLEKKMKDFSERGVNVIAVSVNTEEVAKETHEKWDIKNVPLGYGLSIDEGRKWGLLVSNAISDKEPEQFVEPGLFILDKEGKIYWESIQSMPFGRPEFKDVLKGIDYILKEGYPARGGA